MNQVKKVVFATLAGLLISGCASTSSEGPAKYPELKVLSNTPYVWDDSISEALNVARMAQPAGPGVGMKDFEDGKKAATGKITGGTRLLDAGLGLISMGGFGVLSMESLNAGINRQLDWKPTLVTLVPKNSGQPDYKTVRDELGEKIKEALNKEYPNLVWHGGFTPVRSFADSNTEFLFFDGEGCKNDFKFESKNKDEQKQEFYSDNRRRKFVEGDPSLSKYCVYGGMLEVPGWITFEGKDYWIVSFEAVNGFFHNLAMEKHLDGYVLSPELYDFRAADVPLNMVVNYGYAKVKKKDKELLFQKK